MKLEEFTDVSDILRAGVYLLVSAGEVVYVGKASRSMLGLLNAHRAGDTRTAWFPIPAVRFDRVLVSFIHPDRLEATYQALLAEHNPRYNTRPRAIPTATLERRI